jgi:SAM-dependent methyltransferase
MEKKILYGGGSDFNLVFFFFLKLIREKIYKIFNKKISNFKLVNKILDIGTSPIDNEYQNYLIHKYPHKRNITCVSNIKLYKIKQRYPEIKTLQCDGRRIPLKNNSFDIVISNATIEHVGNKRNQKKFIKEALRLSKKLVFISTPNRYFFIDFHTLIPLIHWLPKKIHRFILKIIGFKFLSKEKNLNLLSTNDLKNMCSVLNVKNYKIEKIKLLGFCTNLILIIYK